MPKEEEEASRRPMPAPVNNSNALHRAATAPVPPAASAPAASSTQLTLYQRSATDTGANNKNSSYAPLMATKPPSAALRREATAASLSFIDEMVSLYAPERLKESIAAVRQPYSPSPARPSRSTAAAEGGAEAIVAVDDDVSSPPPVGNAAAGTGLPRVATLARADKRRRIRIANMRHDRIMKIGRVPSLFSQSAEDAVFKEESWRAGFSTRTESRGGSYSPPRVYGLRRSADKPASRHKSPPSFPRMNSSIRQHSRSPPCDASMRSFRRSNRRAGVVEEEHKMVVDETAFFSSHLIKRPRARKRKTAFYSSRILFPSHLIKKKKAF